ncbi:unnamed protein product [Ilex paraguariensis]|uniref:Uncharacterized protein n=1 Tax=Ilex paraguariensis TaxID=185542 RepID=A0ABC8SB15_9AQUA
MHKAAVAEMLFLLEPNKKAVAIKLIEDSTNSLEWSTWSNDYHGIETRCIAVHKLLGTIVPD